MLQHKPMGNAGEVANDFVALALSVPLGLKKHQALG